MTDIHEARPIGHLVTVWPGEKGGIKLVCSCGPTYDMGCSPSVDEVMVAAMNHWRSPAVRAAS